jgi:eukaryotic-like serine/threonine-protein kinase
VKIYRLKDDLGRRIEYTGVTCLRCGNENGNDARFCNHCGVTLTGSQDGTKPAIDEMRHYQSKPPDPLLGRSIDGRYRIDSLIGAGGMGTVYRATRLLIGDEVAIKILHQDHVDAGSSERFRREAQAAARLKHPNAVSIYDFGISTDGLQYLVMEFIEGESLRERLNHGPLDFAITVEILSQVCAALDEAHRRHIVHRDIKPDNILLYSSADGLRVKVLDFGIAKLRDDTASHLTQTGSVMGTPHYMSPEQCLGEDLDLKSDIYSVGIVLYEMLCGRVPFNSPVSTAVVVQHVSQAPPSPRDINPVIPETVEQVILHAIQKDPSARPATAGTLAQELNVALGRRQVRADDYAKLPRGGSPDASKVELNEVTIERRSSSTAESDLPRTVYLANPALGGQAVRRTNGEHAAATANVKHVTSVKYIGAAAIGISAVTLLLFFVLWQRGGEATKANNSTIAIAGPEETKPAATVSSTPTISERSPTPPGMVPIIGKQFLMGSNEGDADARPAHAVSIKSFYLDIYEVTCEDYKRFFDKTGRPAPNTWTNGAYPPGAAKHPVTGITWDDADAYAKSVGKRLPSEAEWEFAARGPNSLLYPWGNTWRAGCANAGNDGKGLVDVGAYDCNSPFGAQDLIGNAWEWTASDWRPYPGGILATPANGGEKVIRGGSWESGPKFATAAYRSGYKGVGQKTGFRCAMDMP